MKNIFKSLPLALVVMSIISCSSDEKVGQELNDNQSKVITFTCTQEQDTSATRAGLSADAKEILWQQNDKISIFVGTTNNMFSLKDESAGNKSGSFTGTCSESDSYVAVYPYNSNAVLNEDGTVSNIELPATQKAVEGSFDPTASLMMAKSDTKELSFKNAVGWIKVKTDFDCSKIELRAPGELTYIAGNGTLSYNEDAPTIVFTSNQSRTITLVPQTDGGTIEAGTYYIVVPAVSLYAGWRITFTASSDSKEYIRRGSKEINFNRNKIIDLGDFKTSETYWLDPERGIVKAEQEVDLGLTVEIGGTEYKVIFAKSNLTATGLAANEYDYGDYFAWGALEPWYTSYSGYTFSGWKPGKSDGYMITNAPFYNGSSYTEYPNQNNVLKLEHDAANVILGGKWQLPTKEIWKELVDKSSSKGWESTNNGYYFNNDGKTLFLPAAGYVGDASFYNVGSYGYYWSGTACSNMDAYYLGFESHYVGAESGGNRHDGLAVRPVRLEKK